MWWSFKNLAVLFVIIAYLCSYNETAKTPTSPIIETRPEEGSDTEKYESDEAEFEIFNRYNEFSALEPGVVVVDKPDDESDDEFSELGSDVEVVDESDDEFYDELGDVSHVEVKPDTREVQGYVIIPPSKPSNYIVILISIIQIVLSLLPIIILKYFNIMEMVSPIQFPTKGFMNFFGRSFAELSSVAIIMGMSFQQFKLCNALKNYLKKKSFSFDSTDMMNYHYWGLNICNAVLRFLIVCLSALFGMMLDRFWNYMAITYLIFGISLFY
jgi:hypothetical protein